MLRTFLGTALVAALALVAAAGSSVDLAARCRCDQSRGGGGSKKAARQEHRQHKKAARRGGNAAAAYVVQPDGGSPGYSNPYGPDQVQPLGAAAPAAVAPAVQYQWVQQCTQGSGCRWIQVPIAPQAKPSQPQPQAAPQPIADPAFKETQKSEETEAEAAKETTSLDAPAFNAAESQAAWFPPAEAATPDTPDAPASPPVELFAGHEPAEPPEPAK